MFHTILIVDDSAVIRSLLRSRIEENSDWRVCGEAENGKVAVEKVKELHPNIVIMDFQMPVMNGLNAAYQISALFPEIVMVMFTMHSSDELVKKARAAGIREVVTKSDGVADHLLARLRHVCN
jgi:DNA-binding NarL/FixJ family response regulator